MKPEAPLTFPLAGLLAELPGTSRRHPIDEPALPLPDDLRLARPVEGEVEIARTNRGVWVRAAARTTLAEECSRCLRPVVTPVDLQIAEEVLPSVDLTTGKAIDTSAEPEATRLDDHHQLDLGTMLAEAISLAEPIAPLCEPDCPGLCPECGKRLDAGHVPHETDDVDPRLEALRRFRVDADAENG